MAETYSTDELKEMIRETGLRCTNSRTVVLRRLVDHGSPMSHADLTDRGLLHRLDPGDHIWRFEFRGEDDHDDEHPHFMCSDCGEVSCLTSVNISFDKGQRSEVAEVNEIFLKGRCVRCS